MLSRKIMNWMIRGLARIIMRLEIEGLENVPQRGRHILMFNHINFLDAPIAAAFWPHEVEPMTKIENLRSWLLGPFMRLYGVFPVRRGEVDRRALAKAMQVLESDSVLLMSPEGTRSREKGLGEAKDGMTYLALRTDATIVPVAIWGQEKVVPGWRRLKRMPVKMVVGKPFRFVYEGEGKVDRPVVRQMTAEAMSILAGMLPERYRGVLSDAPEAPLKYVRFLDESTGGRN